MTGFDYDPETGYICAGFARYKPSVPATIGCFSVEEYARGTSPKFTAFPTYSDNDLPVSLNSTNTQFCIKFVIYYKFRKNQNFLD